MNKVILINVSGGDRPGLTSSLAETLATYQVRVLDIGQAVVHETLALAILIELPAGEEFTPLKKDLLVRAHDLELKIQFTPVSQQAFEHWVRSQGKFRFIISILGRIITAAQLALVDEVCTVRLYGQILDYRLRSHQGARSLPWFRTRQRPMAES